LSGWIGESLGGDIGISLYLVKEKSYETQALCSGIFNPKYSWREIMKRKTTWKTHTEHGEISTKERKELPESVYAFPKQRKLPLTDAAHVKNALARFDQVEDVSDNDRDLAFANILTAAKHYDIQVEEKNWMQLGKKPHTKNPAHE
jgi:hypothetical protein